ncbi:MAG TPA: hypothetical protein VHX38_25925 [Pseudonocardiaceae bacterium]|jgi:hypothetical protein|nr:hypothetical protein [Pseudonocardiaceae bacterium]
MTDNEPRTWYRTYALSCLNGHLLSVLELEIDGKTAIWDNDNADDDGELAIAPDFYTAMHQLIDIVHQRDTAPFTAGEEVAWISPCTNNIPEWMIYLYPEYGTGNHIIATIQGDLHRALISELSPLGDRLCLDCGMVKPHHATTCDQA